MLSLLSQTRNSIFVRKENIDSVTRNAWKNVKIAIFFSNSSRCAVYEFGIETVTFYDRICACAAPHLDKLMCVFSSIDIAKLFLSTKSFQIFKLHLFAVALERIFDRFWLCNFSSREFFVIKTSFFAGFIFMWVMWNLVNIQRPKFIND